MQSHSKISSNRVKSKAACGQGFLPGTACAEAGREKVRGGRPVAVVVRGSREQAGSGLESVER